MYRKEVIGVNITLHSILIELSGYGHQNLSWVYVSAQVHHTARAVAFSASHYETSYQNCTYYPSTLWGSLPLTLSGSHALIVTPPQRHAASIWVAEGIPDVFI